ncbi:hypothetical protein MYBA111488_24660 [Mycobacterium basiliense]
MPWVGAVTYPSTNPVELVEPTFQVSTPENRLSRNTVRTGSVNGGGAGLGGLLRGITMSWAAMVVAGKITMGGISIAWWMSNGIAGILMGSMVKGPTEKTS